jgi:xylan 1,4-beta-xylosidase
VAAPVLDVSPEIVPADLKQPNNRKPTMKPCLSIFLAAILANVVTAQAAELVIVPDLQGRTVDMTHYGLGQGGFTDQPMLAPHVDDLRQLRPQVIRLFVQEYYDLMPTKGQYNWRKLDRELESIVATGAKPMLCLCMKPPALFPTLDEKIVHPSSYKDWEEFIEQFVRHINTERKFGVEYWEIGNEVEIGEVGGCPYLFKPDDYLKYYTHTVQAILRADPKAKVGGPALGHFDDPIGDALLAHAAAGKAPLHFFSWHTYDNSPTVFQKRIRDVKARIAKYPQLNGVETHVNEWNMSLDQIVPGPGFQPAFLLTVTHMMEEEGLTGANYYQVCDGYVAPATFARFLSTPLVADVNRFFNVLPVRLGLFDQHGRVRPTFYVFRILAQMRGKQWKVSTTDPQLFGMAVESESGLEILFWSFAQTDNIKPMDVAVRLGERIGKRYKLIRLNPASCVDNLETESANVMKKLPDPLQVQLEPYGIRWLTIER